MTSLMVAVTLVQPSASADGTGGNGTGLSASAQVRQDLCRLGYVLHGGGPAIKSAVQQGFAATSDADLHKAADPSYWSSTPTPLHAAFQQDEAAATTKANDLYDRHHTWDKSVPGGFTLPTMTDTGFHWSPNYYSDFGLSGFYGNREMADESQLYVDLAPKAQPASVAAAVQVAKDRHLYNFQDQYNQSLNVNSAETTAWGAIGPQDVWGDGKTITTGSQHADDIRIFLQNGGFPKTALDPGSLEFRLAVEALKLRFASCDSDDPVDPDQAQGQVASTAAAEWKAELDAASGQRAAIVAAEQRASADLAVAAEAMVESVGQAWIADQLAAWQAYWTQHPELRGQPNYPSSGDFSYATTEIGNARNRLAAQLPIVNNAAADAKKQADAATAAEQAAGVIAAANKTPYGRNLAYAQQSAQVTKASAAAAQAAAQAAATAGQAAKAAAQDSAALMSLAKTQALALQAEFKRAAAQEAADQAHYAAQAAADQANQAAAAAARAKASRQTADQAAAATQASAATASKQRQVAEQQRALAAAKRKEADAQRAVAQAAEADAQKKQQDAAAANASAQDAQKTATARDVDAKVDEDQARTARANAATAAQTQDTTAALARAADAQVAATDGTAAAADAKAAAVKAHQDADAAASAAQAAKADADKATNAAVTARAAATQAAGAAAAARDAADNANAAASAAQSQAATAHSAAADAIAAAGQAAQAADNATALAAKAKDDAATSQANATAARALADQARVESNRTAGFAYATAQTAVAARDAAASVVAPANDAIALGSPFRQTDDSAALAVLVGQAAKTVAQQEADAAQARADDAAQAATAAKALADKAAADAKAAAVAASAAAADAAAAANSAAQARASAAAAAGDAAAAAQDDAAAQAASAQAAQDAAAATTASTAADSDAAAALNSATAAERDAAAAQAAAAKAQSDATAAKNAATASDQAAAAAQTAANNAQQLAQDAQSSAATSEGKARIQQQQLVVEPGDAQTLGTIMVTYFDPKFDFTPDPGSMCTVNWGDPTDPNSGCDIPGNIHLYGTLYYTMLTCQLPNVDAVSCIGHYTGDYLGSHAVDLPAKHDTLHVPTKALFDASVHNAVDLLVGDFIGCAQGSAGDCAWAASSLIGPVALKFALRGLSQLRMAIRFGGDIDAALSAASDAVGASGLDGTVLSTIEQEAWDEQFASCSSPSAVGSRVHADATPACPVKMTSVIGNDNTLIKAAEAATRDTMVQKEMDAMFAQLAQGNMNPGKETRFLSGTADVYYARSSNGARLFFRNLGNGTVQIVGKSSKANEDQVMSKLRKLYPK